MSAETFQNIIDIAKFVIFCISVICLIIQIIVAIKNNKQNEFKKLLTEEIVPLMEQAENAFDDGEEKQNWVIKKLGEKLHIDFYKYKKILKIVQNIISEICKTTKINVNNIRIVQEKEEKKNDEVSKIY